MVNYKSDLETNTSQFLYHPINREYLNDAMKQEIYQQVARIEAVKIVRKQTFQQLRANLEKYLQAKTIQ